MKIALKPLHRRSFHSSESAVPLFIFLPGMDGTGELLRSQLNGLKSTFDVLSLSIPPDDLTGWDGLLEAVARLISKERQRQPSRPVYLCGESFGGCLALLLAAHFPHLHDRLIVVNPASSAIHHSWMEWGGALTQLLPDSLYRISTLGLLPLLIAPERVSASNRQALLRAMQSVSPRSAGWRISLLSRFAIEKLPLERILQPVLLLASASDRILPSVTEAARLSRRLVDSHTVLLPESGHACLLETRIELATILRSHRFGPLGSRSHLGLVRS